MPTKQDKFKPIDVLEVDEAGNEKILKAYYIKKPDHAAIVNFSERIHNIAKKYFSNDSIIKWPQLVEVTLSISITESRFKEVDVDNLAKTVLDALKGVAFEDDAQVSTLICMKEIHPLKVNGIFIGITKLTEKQLGFTEGIKMFSQFKWE